MIHIISVILYMYWAIPRSFEVIHVTWIMSITDFNCKNHNLWNILSEASFPAIFTIYCKIISLKSGLSPRNYPLWRLRPLRIPISHTLSVLNRYFISDLTVSDHLNQVLSFKSFRFEQENSITYSSWIFDFNLK